MLREGTVMAVETVVVCVLFVARIFVSPMVVLYMADVALKPYGVPMPTYWHTMLILEMIGLVTPTIAVRVPKADAGEALGKEIGKWFAIAFVCVLTWMVSN